MEEVIQKLSEIETTAKGIMKEAEQTKESMTEDMKKKIQEYNQKAEEESSAKIAQMRKSLELRKEEQLTALNQKTQKVLASMDQYYNANHTQLAHDIFSKIIKS